MEKRLPRTELLFSLGFLFMLAVAVATFLLGMKIGTERTEARYAPKLSETLPPGAASYQQQDLLSYYYTVYQPFRSFTGEWIRETASMKAGQTPDPAKRLKSLAAFANDRYKEAERADIPSSSPLLADAQTNVLKSLKLFSETFSRHANGAAADAQTVIRRIGEDAVYRQALDYALLAEKQYYDAMVKWGASLDPDLPDQAPNGSGMTLETWNSQPLLIKNAIAAGLLKKRRVLPDYYPQDLAARVDHFFDSGQAAGFGISSVDRAVDILLRTEAVRSGDFLEKRTVYGGGELLPQIPMFSGN
ncbi:Putative uncharacterized protein [Thermobacillus xylanilyticus]|uniref:Uncharacterized protein n=1 Tax=Thermobacillus xylanilyticus TaxID=76633 RepID=A0ABN7S077_THEXY|nr:hypothetical protein [Thermobacillus xylanilyticus]CAG5088001.1 Putative uncharacterized protein [Thermobacillus xylanilyticus]